MDDKYTKLYKGSDYIKLKYVLRVAPPYVTEKSTGKIYGLTIRKFLEWWEVSYIHPGDPVPLFDLVNQGESLKDALAEMTRDLLKETGEHGSIELFIS